MAPAFMLKLRVWNEETWLIPAYVESNKDTRTEFTFQVAGQGTNAIIRTSYILGSAETYGDRPPLIRFVETTLEGFTTNPIVLRSYWSQTFTANHTRGQENFLFEPRLEGGLPTGQLAELNAANIAIVHLYRNGLWVEENGREVFRDRPILRLVGLDGATRTFSDEVSGD